MALKPLVPADLTSMMEAGYAPAQQRAAGLNVGSPYGDQTFIQPVMIPVPEKSGVASLRDMYEQKRDVYRSILGDPEEQRSAAQSRALFTIANFGLQLAGATGGRVGASFGERLAQAAEGSQLFPTISAISQQQREAQQKFDLAALQAAETERALALKAAADLKAKDTKSPSLKNLVGPDKTTVLFSFNENDPRQMAEAERIRGQNKGSFYGTPASSSSDSMKEFVAIAPVTVRGVEVPVGGRISLTSEEIKGISPTKIELFRPEKHVGATTQFKALEDIAAGTLPGVKVSLAKGQVVQLTPTQVSAAPTLLERYTSKTETPTSRKQYRLITDLSAEESPTGEPVRANTILQLTPNGVGLYPLGSIVEDKDSSDSVSVDQYVATDDASSKDTGLPFDIVKGSLYQFQAKEIAGATGLGRSVLKKYEKPEKPSKVSTETRIALEDIFDSEGNLVHASGTAFEATDEELRNDIYKGKYAPYTDLLKNDSSRLAFLNTDRMDLYASGKTDAKEDAQISAAITLLTTPTKAFNPETQRMELSPAITLPPYIQDAINKRLAAGLAGPLPPKEAKAVDVLMEEATAITEGRDPETKSVLLRGVDDPLKAFGSATALKSVFNALIPAISFGLAGSPFKPQQEAVDAVNTLNQKFVQFYQKNAELRESVYQIKQVKRLTPSPSSLLTGDDQAVSKASSLVKLIDEVIIAEKGLLDGGLLDAEDTAISRDNIKSLLQLRGAYQLMLNADLAKRGGAENIGKPRVLEILKQGTE